MKNRFRCECGGKLQVVQEVGGSFVYEIDDDGKFNWDDRDFYGDMDEFVSCSECEKVIDATINQDEYIEFEDDLDIEIGDVITLAFEIRQDIELAEWLDDYDGDLIVSQIDKEQEMVWLENCPYGIDLNFVKDSK